MITAAIVFFAMASYSVREIAKAINSVISLDRSDQEPLSEVIQDYFTANSEDFNDSDSDSSDSPELETETGMIKG